MFNIFNVKLLKCIIFSDEAFLKSSSIYLQKPNVLVCGVDNKMYIFLHLIAKATNKDNFHMIFCYFLSFFFSFSFTFGYHCNRLKISSVQTKQG